MAKVKSNEVLVVTARGEHVPAKVLATNKDGTIDVEFVYQIPGAKEPETITITGSKRDDKGKQPDSWHFAGGPAVSSDDVEPEPQA